MLDAVGMAVYLDLVTCRQRPTIIICLRLWHAAGKYVEYFGSHVETMLLVIQVFGDFNIYYLQSTHILKTGPMKTVRDHVCSERWLTE